MLANLGPEQSSSRDTRSPLCWPFGKGGQEVTVVGYWLHLCGHAHALQLSIVLCI